MDAPLFILAPPRSFTTVVCAMIGQHPELYGLPEVNLFAGDTLEHLTRWYRVRARFQHGLLRAVAELGLEGQTEENVERATTWLDDNADSSTASIFGDLAQWAEPRRLVDKSPIYVIDDGALERILAAYPEARFLHLTRHPRATCQSLLGLRGYIEKAGGKAGSMGLDPWRAWLQPHTRVKEFLDTLPSRQWVRLRGEELLGQPDLYLPQVAEWLEVRTDDDAIEAMKHPEASPFARLGPGNARFGSDPGFMENPVLRPFHAKPMNLHDPLEWSPDSHFSDELKHHAAMFGYL